MATRDDYLNLDTAPKAGLAIGDHVTKLKETVGPRNKLVHEYNGLDDAVTLEAIRHLRRHVQGFLEEVEDWLTSQP